MAEKQFGTAHLFGIGAEITNLTLSAVDLEKNFNLDQKTPDQNGVTIENRMDDRMITGSITAFAKAAFTIPKQGDLITLSGLNDDDLNEEYCIKSIGQSHRAGEKYSITLNLEWHEAIDYSPA